MKHKAHYLSNLTPLRGIAALMVAVFHFNSTIAVFLQPQRSMIIAKSYLMVDLFFIMSGFIIVHVYCSFFNRQIKGSPFKKFIVARFARIYPLHLFTLLLMVSVVGALVANGMPNNPVTDFAAIPTHLLLLHSFGIHNIFTWNVPSWSISAEWWAYMVFPFLVLFLNRSKRVAVVTLTIFVLSAYLAILFWLPRYEPFHPEQRMAHNLDTTYDFGFLRGLAGFISGMLLYELYQLQGFRRWFRNDATAFFFIISTLVCLHIGINDGLYILLFAGMVVSFASNGSYLYRFCNFRVGQYIGKISYSIYMMQVFMLLPFALGVPLPGLIKGENGAPNLLPFESGLLYCLLYLLGIIGLSSLTYYTIEQPLRKRINKWWGKEKNTETTEDGEQWQSVLQ